MTSAAMDASRRLTGENLVISFSSTQRMRMRRGCDSAAQAERAQISATCSWHAPGQVDAPMTNFHLAWKQTDGRRIEEAAC